ncbi:MAG: ferredoxin reductase [Micromonosporaceae bacterium]
MARLVASREETPSARTLVLHVDGWPGHLPGQHVDVRLTAEDGYQTQRSYSIASAPDGERVELTVQRVPGGEVSEYLTGDYPLGAPVEVRGPVGGWFVWRPGEPDRVLLVAGGSGVVPLMAMIRTRARAGGRSRFRLVYSARTPVDVYYAGELHQRSHEHPWLDVGLLYTRAAPAGHPRPPGRLMPADLLPKAGWEPSNAPLCYVCGPTGFVEAAADLLVGLGHHPDRIRTERFGPTGG